MLSNLLLGLFAFYLYFQHRAISKRWSLFFFFVGFSAMVGGVYHGFPVVGGYARFLSWPLLSASLIFAQLAAYKNINNITVKIFFVIKSIVLLVISIQTANFGFMVIDTGISMIGFIVIGNIVYIKTLPKPITYGILISLASAFFNIYKISFSVQYLNYNDIGHYISILSLIVISKGVREDSINQMKKESIEITKPLFTENS